MHLPGMRYVRANMEDEERVSQALAKNAKKGWGCSARSRNKVGRGKSKIYLVPGTR